MERNIFEISGPTHLNPVNWKCEHHRRSIAACLVQSAYLLERERQLNYPEERFAPTWFEFFQFELIQTLVDDVDATIFGAIFELSPPGPGAAGTPEAPRFVVTFRGTMTKSATIMQDLLLNLSLVQHYLHNTSRFATAMQAVEGLVSAFPGSPVWLAGHSLGAAMAILAGKNMARSGIFLESFIFNPPFIAAAIKRALDNTLMPGFGITGSMIAAGVLQLIDPKPRNENPAATGGDHFAILSSWIPNLFINPNDAICSGFIGYFEHQVHVEEMGARFTETLATQNKISRLFLRSIGLELDPLHLLPSANVVVNRSPSPDFSYAHGLRQWWQPGLALECALHFAD